MMQNHHRPVQASPRFNPNIRVRFGALHNANASPASAKKSASDAKRAVCLDVKTYRRYSIHTLVHCVKL
ncbi:hypothetical protein JXJ21_11705 [candidate division KSB1 bacterium]|nr:hypothetical protein [candidate division KSB1 bacterium]